MDYEVKEWCLSDPEGYFDELPTCRDDQIVLTRNMWDYKLEGTPVPAVSDMATVLEDQLTVPVLIEGYGPTIQDKKILQPEVLTAADNSIKEPMDV